MKTIIYGKCGHCERIGEYDAAVMKSPLLARCKKCKGYVWRHYTNAELDMMREGERVE